MSKATQKEQEAAARAKGLIVGWDALAEATGFAASTLRVYASKGKLPALRRVGRVPAATAALIAKIADLRVR